MVTNKTLYFGTILSVFSFFDLGSIFKNQIHNDTEKLLHSEFIQSVKKVHMKLNEEWD